MDREDDRIVFRRIQTIETIPLRWAVLRPGRPEKTAHFQGDDDPGTLHFGLFRDQELVGTASLFAVEAPGIPGIKAFQLRGMAIASTYQRAGLGGALLRGCIKDAFTGGTRILWCNARTSAAGFYQKHGFEIVSEEFEIPDVGPHFKMLLKL